MGGEREIRVPLVEEKDPFPSPDRSHKIVGDGRTRNLLKQRGKRVRRAAEGGVGVKKGIWRQNKAVG